MPLLNLGKVKTQALAAIPVCVTQQFDRNNNQLTELLLNSRSNDLRHSGEFIFHDTQRAARYSRSARTTNPLSVHTGTKGDARAIIAYGVAEALCRSKQQ